MSLNRWSSAMPISSQCSECRRFKGSENVRRGLYRWAEAGTGSRNVVASLRCGPSLLLQSLSSREKDVAKAVGATKPGDMLLWEFGRASDAVRQYAEFCETAPDDVDALGVHLTGPDGQKLFAVS